MKHTITYTLGYVGYFLIAYTGLRLMFFHEDKVGFVIITAALLLSQGYSTYLEKQIVIKSYQQVYHRDSFKIQNMQKQFMHVRKRNLTDEQHIQKNERKTPRI